jgi:hypothetical protein
MFYVNICVYIILFVKLYSICHVYSSVQCVNIYGAVNKTRKMRIKLTLFLK